MKECLLCQIARHEISAHLVQEDKRLLAFLDIHPIRPGHTQIIPKEHYPYFDDMPGAVCASIIRLGQRLAVAMKRIYRVPRVAFLFTGGDIAHAHAHVVPMHEKTDITSRRYIAEDVVTFRNAARASDADLAACAVELREACASLARRGRGR